MERYAEEVVYQRRNVVLAALFTAPAHGALHARAGHRASADLAAGSWRLRSSSSSDAQFHGSGLKRLPRLDANMDTLISIGTLAAYGYSVWAVFADQPVFFETAAMIITLILLGRFFEARAKGSASQAIAKLLELGAKQARVLRDGEPVMVDPLNCAPARSWWCCPVRRSRPTG